MLQTFWNHCPFHRIPWTVQSKLTIKREGQVIPRESTLEIKTRVTHRPLELSEVAPQLWVSQTPKLVRAYHKRGKFSTPKVEDITAVVKQWEQNHKDDIKKLVALINRILWVVRNWGGSCTIRYNPAENWRSKKWEERKCSQTISTHIGRKPFTTLWHRRAGSTARISLKKKRSDIWRLEHFVVTAWSRFAWYINYFFDENSRKSEQGINLLWLVSNSCTWPIQGGTLKHPSTLRRVIEYNNRPFLVYNLLYSLVQLALRLPQFIPLSKRPPNNIKVNIISSLPRCLGWGIWAIKLDIRLHDKFSIWEDLSDNICYILWLNIKIKNGIVSVIYYIIVP